MMETDCLFCKFIKGEIETQKVFENTKVLGFKDIAPQAQEHYLFIHKEHSKNVFEMGEKNIEHISEIFIGINEFAKDSDLVQRGFRIVTNNGASAGQTIFHTHFHVLSGPRLGSFGK